MDACETNRERTIRFNPYKLVLLFVPVFALIGLSLMWNPQQWVPRRDWTTFVFAALPVFLIAGCWCGPRLYFVNLSPEGLLVHRTTPHLYRWDEVSNFRVTQGPGSTGQRIVWNLADDSSRRTAVIDAAAAVNGYHDSLLDVFEIPAVEVVVLLNEWKQRYAKRSSDESDTNDPHKNETTF